MHTYWIRLNAVVFFSLSVLLAMSLLSSFTSSLSTLRHETALHPIVEVLQLAGGSTREGIKSFKSHGGVDRAALVFDLLVDLKVSVCGGDKALCLLGKKKALPPTTRQPHALSHLLA